MLQVIATVMGICLSKESEKKLGVIFLFVLSEMEKRKYIYVVVATSKEAELIEVSKLAAFEHCCFVEWEQSRGRKCKRKNQEIQLSFF